MGRRWLAYLAFGLWSGGAWAADEATCQSAVAAAAQKSAIPHRVLGTIALVESGRIIGGRVVPWPWSINVGGTGQVFPSKAEAVAAVRDLQAAGTRSIDVGCMQINLAAHPEAFSSLDAAFDPGINAEYAAHFLRTLVQQTGQLATAMTAYHSQTPEYAADYARRLLTVWPGAMAIGVTAETARPSAPAHLYSPRLAQQLSDDHVALQRYRSPPPSRSPVSRIEYASSRGPAWPGATR